MPAILLGALAPAPLLAQGGLPPTVVRAGDLTPEQLQQVREYPAEALVRLGSDAASEIRAARARLLEPLRDTQATVRFRQAYSDAVVPRLAELSRDTRELNALNALRVLGEVGTPAAMEAIDAAMRDQRVAVRYAAVVGLERTLNAIRLAGPAVGAERLGQSIARAGELLRAESQPELAIAAVRTLGVGVAMERQGFGALRTQSLSVLAAATRQRFPQLGGPAGVAMHGAVLAAAQVSRDALTQATNPQLALSPQATRDAAEVSGHALTYVFRALRGGDFNDRPEARASAAQIAATAEAAIIVANGNKLQAMNLGDELRRGGAEGDRAFNTKALQAFGALAEPPLGFAADHFVKP